MNPVQLLCAIARDKEIEAIGIAKPIPMNGKTKNTDGSLHFKDGITGKAGFMIPAGAG